VNSGISITPNQTKDQLKQTKDQPKQAEDQPKQTEKACAKDRSRSSVDNSPEYIILDDF